LASDLSSGVSAQVYYVDCGASSVFASAEEMAQIQV
jgi:enoyl-[acyl-carrier-protein] reductase (NADH)